MSFAVDRCLEPDGVCVAVAGELDIDSAPRMHQPLAAAVAAGESVAIDLGASTFMDSSGLTALISTDRPAEAAGMSFRLQRVPPAILRLLALTGIDAILTINPASASALARPGPRRQPDAPAPAAGHLFSRGVRLRPPQRQHVLDVCQ
jgi:anti-sigma B factor antagonist